MDKLNLTQTYHDNSLMYRWEHCRLIGLINKVYFIILLSAIVIPSLLYALVTGINCLVCDPHFHGDTDSIYNCMLCTMFMVYCLFLWPVIILLLIIPIGLLKMVNVNNGLRSTSISIGEKNVKTWLRYHIGFLILSLMSLGGLSSENHSAKGLHFFFTGIQCVVLMIEIYAVNQFHTDSKIAADRRNRSFEISNDI